MEYDYEGLWNEALLQLRTDLGEEEFSAWFTDVRYLRSEENCIVVAFPSGFHRDRVRSRYRNSIKEKLKNLIPYLRGRWFGENPFDAGHRQLYL